MRFCVCDANARAGLGSCADEEGFFFCDVGDAGDEATGGEA